MFLQGGGWCWDEDGCWSRAFNKSDELDGCYSRAVGHGRGSTKDDAATFDFNTIGLLTSDRSLNPLFYDWNKIYVRSCDGMSFGGDAVAVVTKNGTHKMYYRGRRILDAVFGSLRTEHHLDAASDFVISGSSAGGLAVLWHTNYIARNFLNLSSTKVVSMPETGFFIEHNGWKGQTQWANHMRVGFEMHNVSSSIVDAACLDSDCVFAQNIAGDNIIPTFVLNSQYDSYQAQCLLGTGTENAALLNEWGRNFTRILTESFLSRSDNMYGAYIDGCYRHSGLKFWAGLNIDGFTQATAFAQFYKGLGEPDNRRLWYQNVTFPCEACCPQTGLTVGEIVGIVVGCLALVVLLVFPIAIYYCDKKRRSVSPANDFTSDDYSAVSQDTDNEQ